ncbi:MAG TPA: hypothetical protein VMD30_12565 [Tepidisphaeraceae bacterium]|nr:hypothetical protein [Tepidisphaeraceae bacterium]
MSSNPIPPSAPAPPNAIIARPGARYRWTHCLVAAGLFIYGLWSIYDGFINYPQVDDLIRNTQGPFAPLRYDALDIHLNQTLGIALPIVAVLLIFWMLRRSRGQYRLENGTLFIPGHPPMSLEEIDSVDRGKWDRKGIALVTYRLHSGQTGSFRLDDYLYDQTPTDEIFKRIEASLLTPPTETNA